MTSRKDDPNFGLPPPITELTYEQDLKLRLIEDKLQDGFHDNKDDIITWIIALQHQNFVLTNSLTNLVKKWPHEKNIPLRPGEGISIKIQHQ